MRELDHQSPSTSLQTSSRVRYQDLPPDVQGRLLADINQDRMDFEAQQQMTDLSTQPLSLSVRKESSISKSFFFIISSRLLMFQ